LKKILHSAIDKIYKPWNLTEASRKVRKNKGSGGVDKVSMEKWKEQECKYLQDLRKQLKVGSYKSKPVKRVYIEKPGSKGRLQVCQVRRRCGDPM